MDDCYFLVDEDGMRAIERDVLLELLDGADYPVYSGKYDDEGKDIEHFPAVA